MKNPQEASESNGKDIITYQEIKRLIASDAGTKELLEIFNSYFVNKDCSSCCDLLETLNNHENDDEDPILLSSAALDLIIQKSYGPYLLSFSDLDNIELLPFYMETIIYDFFDQNKDLKITKSIITDDDTKQHEYYSIKGRACLKYITDGINLIDDQQLRERMSSNIIDFIIDGIFCDSFFERVNNNYFGMFEMVLRLFKQMESFLLDSHYESILTSFSSLLETLEKPSDITLIDDFKILKSTCLHLQITLPFPYRFIGFDILSFFVKKNIPYYKTRNQQEAANFIQQVLVPFSDCWHNLLGVFCDKLNDNHKNTVLANGVSRDINFLQVELERLEKNKSSDNTPKDKLQLEITAKKDELERLRKSLTKYQDEILDQEDHELLQTDYGQIIQVGFAIRQELKVNAFNAVKYGCFPVNKKLFSYGFTKDQNPDITKEFWTIGTNFVKLLMRNSEFESYLEKSGRAPILSLSEYIADIESIYTSLRSSKDSSIINEINNSHIPVDDANIEFIGTAFSSYISHLVQRGDTQTLWRSLYTKDVLQGLKFLGFLLRFYNLDKNNGFNTSPIILNILQNHLSYFVRERENIGLWDEMAAVILEFIMLDGSYKDFSIDFLLPEPADALQTFESFDTFQFASYFHLLLSLGFTTDRVDYIRSKIEDIFYPIFESKFKSYDVGDNNCLKMTTIIKSISIKSNANGVTNEDIKISFFYPIESDNDKYYNKILKNLTAEYWQGLYDVEENKVRNILNILIIAFNIAKKDSLFHKTNIPEFFKLTIHRNMADTFIDVVGLTILILKNTLSKQTLSSSDRSFLQQLLSSDNSQGSSEKIFGYDIIRSKGHYLFADLKFVEASLDGLIDIGNILNILVDSHPDIACDLRSEIVKVFNNMHSLLHERYAVLIKNLQDNKIKNEFEGSSPKSMTLLLEKQRLPRNLHYCLATFFNQYINIKGDLKAYKHPAFGDVAAGDAKVCQYFKISYSGSSGMLIYSISVDNHAWYSFNLIDLLKHPNYYEDVFPYKLMLLVAEDKSVSLAFFSKDGQEKHLLPVVKEEIFADKISSELDEISLPNVTTTLSKSFVDTYNSNDKSKKLKKFWANILAAKRKLEKEDASFFNLLFEDIEKYKVPHNQVSTLGELRNILIKNFESEKYFTLKLLESFINVRDILTSTQQRDLTKNLLDMDIADSDSFIFLMRILILSQDTKHALDYIFNLLECNSYSQKKNYDLSYFLELFKSGFFKDTELSNMFQFALREFTNSRAFNSTKSQQSFTKVPCFFDWSAKNGKSFMEKIDLALKINSNNLSYCHQLETFLLFQNWQKLIHSENYINDAIFWMLYLQQKKLAKDLSSENGEIRVAGVPQTLLLSKLNAVLSNFIGLEVRLGFTTNLRLNYTESASIFSDIRVGATYQDSKKYLLGVKDSLHSQVANRQQNISRCQTIYDKFLGAKFLARPDLEFLYEHSPDKIIAIRSAYIATDLWSHSLEELYRFWLYISENMDILEGNILHESDIAPKPGLSKVRYNIENMRQDIFSSQKTIDDFLYFLSSVDNNLVNTLIEVFLGKTTNSFFPEWNLMLEFWDGNNSTSKLEHLTFYITVLGLIKNDRGQDLLNFCIDKIVSQLDDIYGCKSIHLDLNTVNGTFFMSKNTTIAVFNINESFAVNYEIVKSIKRNLIADLIGMIKIPTYLELKVFADYSEIVLNERLRGFDIKFTDSKIYFSNFDQAYIETNKLLQNIENKLDSNVLLRLRNSLPFPYLVLFSKLFERSQDIRVTGYFAWLLEKYNLEQKSIPAYLISLISEISTITMIADFDNDIFINTLESSSFFKVASGGSPCRYYREANKYGVRLKQHIDDEYIHLASSVYSLSAMGIFRVDQKEPINRSNVIFKGDIYSVRQKIWDSFPWSLSRLSKWIKRFAKKEYVNTMQRHMQYLEVGELSMSYSGHDWSNFIKSMEFNGRNDELDVIKPYIPHNFLLAHYSTRPKP